MRTELGMFTAYASFNRLFPSVYVSFSAVHTVELIFAQSVMSLYIYLSFNFRLFSHGEQSVRRDGRIDKRKKELRHKKESRSRMDQTLNNVHKVSHFSKVLHYIFTIFLLCTRTLMTNEKNSLTEYFEAAAAAAAAETVDDRDGVHPEN